MNNVELGLSEVLEIFWDGEHWSRYCDDASIIERIETYLENNPEVKEYQIDEDTLFENSSYETGYVAVSWVDNDGLHLEILQWEVF